MRQLNKNLCLLHLAYFLGFVTEEYYDSIEDSFSLLPYTAAKSQLFRVMEKRRVTELGLEENALLRWADLAYGLQSMAADYDPRGIVRTMDVFHARPLRAVAKSRQNWIENHLSKWQNFCETEPGFHAVGGAHNTMIGSDHVETFATTLKTVLKARGL